MSSRWRVKHRRADGSFCNHPAGEHCDACERDKQKPIGKPLAVTFELSAEGLEQTLWEPWEQPRDITSRSELLAVCEEKGLDSKYLKESMSWPYRKPREI